MLPLSSPDVVRKYVPSTIFLLLRDRKNSVMMTGCTANDNGNSEGVRLPLACAVFEALNRTFCLHVFTTQNLVFGTTHMELG